MLFDEPVATISAFPAVVFCRIQGPTVTRTVTVATDLRIVAVPPLTDLTITNFALTAELFPISMGKFFSTFVLLQFPFDRSKKEAC